MRMDTASTRSGRARRERVTCPVGGGPRAAADAVCHDVGDAVAGLAVAVWAGDFRRRILIRPDEFLMEGLGDLVPICSYQPRQARTCELASRSPRSAACWTASMMVLPVTKILVGSTPSARRFAAARGVAAKCRSATASVRRRIASSGNGAYLLKLRRPAST